MNLTTILPILAPVLAGGLRNVAGWLENALKDGSVSKYEWGQLGSTVLQVVVLSFGAMYGLGLGAVPASGLGVLASMIISALKSSPVVPSA